MNYRYLSLNHYHYYLYFIMIYPIVIKNHDEKAHLTIPLYLFALLSSQISIYLLTHALVLLFYHFTQAPRL
jgi:hypothetical protein